MARATGCATSASVVCIWTAAREFVSCAGMEPVLEPDGTPARDFFTVLNTVPSATHDYSVDQLTNVHTFSVLYGWLLSLYGSGGAGRSRQRLLRQQQRRRQRQREQDEARERRKRRARDERAAAGPDLVRGS